MYRGFPANLLSILRCPHDSGTLDVRDQSSTPSAYVRQAALRCGTCRRSYPIEEGIVRFLDPTSLDGESNNERTLREQGAPRYNADGELSAWQQMEIVPTLAALKPLKGSTMLELGAGTGRYTVRLAEQQAQVIAVDFSFASLQQLATRLQSDWNVGLVHADCTQFAVQPHSFDIVMSTLVSNLPTAQHRAAMMEVAAKALKPNGKFVFSTHYYGLGNRLRREPQSGHYREGGIYRYLFRRREILKETKRYFQTIWCQPIQIGIPLANRLRLPVVALSRAAQRIPLLNQFGELLLVVARPPEAPR
ncbi:MAG: methyltransferase domain-containing protein [Gammaproteobacteria bacterium]|nr:methyltransferase domain-containing protein [Gammaproteobacteria bacterium]